MSYEFLDHLADVKFKANGATIEEMFVSASQAINDVIRGDIKILEQKDVTFNTKGKDVEELLYNFLEEFLFLLESEDFLVSSIKELVIDVNNFELKTVLSGDSADNYKFTNDVKAVTYSEMKIKKTDRGFECEVVLDV